MTTVKNPLTIKINGFVEHRCHGVHNLSTDQLTLAFSNTAPASETPDPTLLTADAVLANVTEVDYTNLGNRNLTTTLSAQTNGVYYLRVASVSIPVAGGNFGPFRYVYVFNSDATAVSNPLLVCYDFRAEYAIEDGDSFDCTFDTIAGLFVSS